MIRKRETILKRAWDIISLSIRRKRKLFFKKQQLELRRRYNYAFAGDYEFTPLSAPIFHHLRPLFKKRNRISSFLLCDSSSANADRTGEDEKEMLGEAVLLYGKAAASDDRPNEEAELADEEDESVDGRADRFIEKFYEELRIQRQDSIMHYRKVLIKSCI